MNKCMELSEIYSSIIDASQRIAPYVFHTPLEHSLPLSNQTKANVYLKLESQQKTGSFKVRGAFNKLLLCGKDSSANRKEYVTASTGNHGLACALAFTTLKKKGVVYVPTNVSSAKERSLQIYGVELCKFGEDCVETESEARRAAKDLKRIYISPYADMEIIFGQGTIGKELIDDLPCIDAVFVTVGGGGLISGIGSYTKMHKQGIEVVGCLPENSAVMFESVKVGHVVELPYVDTLSDASAGGIEEDSPTLELCQTVVDRWVLVTEDEIANAMHFMLENHNKIVEGSAGVALASFLKHSSEYVGKNVVILICGGNISMEKLNFIMKNH